MTYYAKAVARLFASGNSDYSLPSFDSKTHEHALTPTLYLHQRLHLSTSETVLDLSGFTSITAMLIVNHSATAAEMVQAKWCSLRGVAPAGNVNFTIAATSYISDADGLRDYADTYGGSVGGYVVVSSAEDAANDGAYQITGLADVAATNDRINLASAPGQNNANDTTAVLTFYGLNWQDVAPSDGQLLVTSDVYPTGDLSLTAKSGTPEIEVFVIGA